MPYLSDTPSSQFIFRLRNIPTIFEVSFFLFDFLLLYFLYSCCSTSSSFFSSYIARETFFSFYFDCFSREFEFDLKFVAQDDFFLFQFFIFLLHRTVNLSIYILNPDLTHFNNHTAILRRRKLFKVSKVLSFSSIFFCCFCCCQT